MTGVQTCALPIWERKEDQRFLGSLKIIVENKKLTGINVIHVEDYLTSVIEFCPFFRKKGSHCGGVEECR